MENLQEKLPSHLLNLNWCILCKKHNESTNHIFLSCTTTAFVWNKMASEIGWHNNHVTIDSLCKDLLLIKQTSNKKIITFNLAAAILWTLWVERNNIIFSNKGRNYNQLWEDMCMLTGLWSHRAISFKDYNPSTIALNLNALCIN